MDGMAKRIRPMDRCGSLRWVGVTNARARKERGWSWELVAGSFCSPCRRPTCVRAPVYACSLLELETNQVPRGGISTQGTTSCPAETVS